MELLLLIVAAVALVVLIRLFAGGLDKQRIDDYVRQLGGRVQSIRWSPLGRGWFGERNARIYEVVYYDAQGSLHRATCKTSLFSGVYWTEDQVVGVTPHVANPTDQLEFLQTENEQLRREIERLRGQDSRAGRDR